VLTLLSMISTVLFQGYGYMMGNYQRLRDRQMSEFREALVSGWLRSSLESLVPFYENDLRFSGSPRAMRGASFAALWGYPGVASEINWSFESDASELRLVYSEPPHEPVVVERWSAGEQARFEYLSESGDWLPEWRTGVERQIPEAIRAVVSERTGSEVVTSVTAVIPIRKSQHIPSSVILYGRE